MSPHRVFVGSRRMTVLAAMLFADTALAICPPVTLIPRASQPTQSGPVSVVVADFTGDGVPDLTTTQSGASTIGLLPGHATGGIPDGTFGPRTDTQVGGTPYGLAAADLDGDGLSDLIVGNWGANTVQVLLNLGGGSLAAPVAFAAGSKPYEVAVADFNADGVQDIAVADNGENSMRILIGGNDGSGHWDGGFLTSVAYPTSNLPLSIVTGDLNNDGIVDVMVTEYLAETVAVFLGYGSPGAGDGTFRQAVHTAAGTEPYDLATGDFNADGRLDLAVANSGGAGGVHVLLGSASGYFPVDHHFLAGVNCSGVSPADLDGDGITDLVVSTSVGNAVHLLRGLSTAGQANGTFDAPVTLADCCFPVHVVAADLDLDGRPDAVTCGYQSNSLGVFMDGCQPDPNLPVITSVRDVPNDQGGKLFLTWTRSALDVTGGAVNAYCVWRQVPPAGVATRARPVHLDRVRSSARLLPNGSTEIVYWEALATLPARRLAGYGYTAATPQDSLPSSNPKFTFFISALTANIEVFYDSDPDSGYSVDNLAPAAPAGLVAGASGSSTTLHWQANAEADLGHYELHRASDPAFTPSPATLVASPVTNEFLDPNPAGAATYKLAAVDAHGNHSGFVTLLATQVTGVASSPRGDVWLGSPFPNPGRGTLEVRFALAHAGPAELVLLDAQGRRVRTLTKGTRPAGEWSVPWDGRDDAGRAVGAGLYWLELRAGSDRRVVRLARLR